VDTPSDFHDTVADAYSVIDEALLDPILRVAIERQAARRRHRRIKELLRSSDRVAAFIEQEKEILGRLGASREWCDAFFRDLDLEKKLPAGLSVIYAPDQLYQNLEKLRLALAILKRPDVMISLAPAQAQPSPGQQVTTPPVSRGMSRPRQALAGAMHGTFGLFLILGNFSGFAALLFTAPIVAPATSVSYGIGGMAVGRAYVRLTEAIGL
jgi:hypothetical protein